MADNVTTDELEKALQDLATSLGQATKEYVEGQDYANHTELNEAVEKLQSQITAIIEMDDNGVESLAEKIKAIHDVVSNEDGVVQEIFNKIVENATAISDEVSRAKGVEQAIKDALNTLANKTNSNETAIIGLSDTVSGIDSRVATAEGTLTTLTGDETVEGSIKKQIADEASRTNTLVDSAKNEAVESAKGYTDTKVSEAKDALQAQIDEITGGTEGSISELSDKVKTIESTLEDTNDADGNLVKGIKTRVSDLETGLASGIAEAKAYADSKVLKASSMDICGIGNKFRQALGLADKTCDGSSDDGDGAVL